MPEEIVLTEEGARKLREELDRLKGPVREDLAKRLKSAIEMGDLSENADYKAAKEEQGFIEGRIKEIEYTLSWAKVVENTNRDFRTVDIGNKVTVQEEGAEPEIYTIVGLKEASPREGKISYESPIGNALKGKHLGDVVVVKTPQGEFSLKILKIEAA